MVVDQEVQEDSEQLRLVKTHESKEDLMSIAQLCQAWPSPSPEEPKPSSMSFVQQLFRRKNPRETKTKLLRIRKRPPKPPPVNDKKHLFKWKNLRGTKTKLFQIRKRPPGPPPSPADDKQVITDHAGKCKSKKRKLGMINQFYAPDETKSFAVERAKEIQMNLEPEFPSFVKSMLRSHVTYGFWLGIPVKFSQNLPKQDCMITLVDESGEEHFAKFLVEKVGLSAGWRGFSIAHNLVEGDALVFQLVKATKFKVYIIRANGLAEVDGALALLNLDMCAARFDAGSLEDNADEGEGKHSYSLPSSIFQDDNQNSGPLVSVSNPGPPAGEHSENDSEVVGSEVLEGIRLSDSIVEFKDVKNIENFTIMVNGLIIDSELPQHIRAKYYELCCSQKAFLHDHLLEGINCKLITGIISETVNIADAIRAFRLTTSWNDFSIWDKSLNAFEMLGMNVGFLRARLHKLVSLAFASEDAVDSKMYREAILKRANLEEEMRTLEVKLVELKEAWGRYDTDINTLKLKAERHELKFKSKARASW